jgi:periplasmic protein TonB
VGERRSRRLERVIVAALVCGVAGGCTTAPRGGVIEAVSDCRRLGTAPAPAPAVERSRTEPVTERTSSSVRLLLNPRLDTSQLPREVETHAGTEEPPPLDPSDPRIQRYFAAIKGRIETIWTYPLEAAKLKQTGSGMARFRVARDGSVREVEIIESTGASVLDHYLLNAILLAAPFPSIPCPISEASVPLTITFRYTLPKAP